MNASQSNTMIVVIRGLRMVTFTISNRGTDNT